MSWHHPDCIHTDPSHPRAIPCTMPTDRRWSDADRELVARTIHDHACPSDQDAGCNWTEDGTECRLTEFMGFAAAVLDAVLPDHDARVRAEVAEEIPGWTHEQDVTYDGDTHWLECAWCNAPVTPIEAGDSLELMFTAARDHHRTCAHLKAARAKLDAGFQPRLGVEGDHHA